jgi:hypothetical protein
MHAAYYYQERESKKTQHRHVQLQCRQVKGENATNLNEDEIIKNKFDGLEAIDLSFRWSLSTLLLSTINLSLPVVDLQYNAPEFFFRYNIGKCCEKEMH